MIDPDDVLFYYEDGTPCTQRMMNEHEALMQKLNLKVTANGVEPIIDVGFSKDHSEEFEIKAFDKMDNEEKKFDK